MLCKNTLSIGYYFLYKTKKHESETIHKNLYHTLFERYLSYGIFVWCGSPKAKFLPFFKAQKKFMWATFGDRVKYLEKFKTFARVNPLNGQRLTTIFFSKEHKKPLFNKIFKYKTSIAINDLFKFSRRGQKSLFIITPPPNDWNVYRMSVMWNSVRTVLSCPDTSFPISSIKTKLKVFLLNKQKLGDYENWIEHNFA